jgi:hypothetical protein
MKTVKPRPHAAQSSTIAKFRAPQCGQSTISGEGQSCTVDS